MQNSGDLCQFFELLLEIIADARRKNDAEYADAIAPMRDRAAAGDEFFALTVKIIDKYSGHCSPREDYDPITDTTTAGRDC